MGKYISTPLQGLILRDDRFSYENLDLVNSSYSQASPEPDQPQPSAAGFMELQSLGDLSTAQSLDIQTVRAGLPVGSSSGGRFKWKQSTDSATGYRGFLESNKVTSFQYVKNSVGQGSASAVRTPSHKVIAVFRQSSSVGAAVLDPSTNAWTSTYTVTSAGAFDPCIIRLPDNTEAGGRLLCFYVRNDYTEAGATYFTIGMSYSDDDGATWTLGADHLAGWKIATASRTMTKIRGTYHQGFITLITEGAVSSAPSIWHLLSDDVGASVQQIENILGTYTGGAIGGRHASDVVSLEDGTVHLFYGETSSTDIKRATKGSPNSKFSTSPDYDSTAVSGADVDKVTIVGNGLAAVVDDEGYIVLVWRRNTTLQNIGYARISPTTLTEVQDEWTSSGSTVKTNWAINHCNDPAEYLRDMCLCPHKSSILLLGTFVSPAGPATEPFVEVRLGGYSSEDWQTQTFGAHGSSPLTTSGQCWFATCEPGQTVAWSDVPSSAGTTSFPASGYQIQTSSQIEGYERDGGSAKPCIMWIRCLVATGGATTGDQISAQIVHSDGSTEYKVSLRLSTTEALLRDIHGGANLGSQTGLSSGVMRDYLIALSAGKASAWLKTPSDTLWTQIVRGATVAGTSVSPAANNKFRWGHLDTSTANTTWLQVLTAGDDLDIVTGLTTATKTLQGRAFSQLPLFVRGGYKIQSRGSSTYSGDAWTAGTRYQYGIQNIHPEIQPSPSITWRSTDETEQIIIWKPAGSTATRPTSTSWGLHLSGINFRTAFLEAYDTVSASWVTLASLDGHTTIAATGTQLPDVSGNVITPDGSTPTADRYIERHELVGSRVSVSYTGGSGSSPVYLEVTENTEGYWSPVNDVRVPELLASGLVGNIGTPTGITFLPKRLTAVIHGVSTSYASWRLRIPAQSTKEGYFEIGSFLFGPFMAFGQRYAWGRVLGTVPNVELITDSAGHRQARQLGPSRRTVEFAWVDGVDQTDLYTGSPPTPDEIVARDHVSYKGLAVRRDLVALRGMIEQIQGSVNPVVYLPSVDLATASTTVYQYSAPSRAIYGRIVSPITQTSILGQEDLNEVLTCDSITIEEEV